MQHLRDQSDIFINDIIEKRRNVQDWEILPVQRSTGISNMKNWLTHTGLIRIALYFIVKS